MPTRFRYRTASATGRAAPPAYNIYTCCLEVDIAYAIGSVVCSLSARLRADLSERRAPAAARSNRVSFRRIEEFPQFPFRRKAVRAVKSVNSKL